MKKKTDSEKLRNKVKRAKSYYYINTFLEIHCQAYLGDDFDDTMLALGNCFLKIDDAEKALGKICVILRKNGIFIDNNKINDEFQN